MDALHITLRIVHIVAGVFWVGTVAFLVLFLEPTTRALGPQAGPFMAHLNLRLKLPIVTAAGAGLTILAGLWLYWRDSDGFDVDWITSAVGLGFTVGAVAAIAAFAMGSTILRATSHRLGELGGALAASGGPPSPEQASEIQVLQQRMRVWGRTVFTLLVVSVVAMAAARFLG